MAVCISGGDGANADGGGCGGGTTGPVIRCKYANHFSESAECLLVIWSIWKMLTNTLKIRITLVKKSLSDL